LQFSGHLSTIYCTIANFDYDEVSYSRTLLRVPDGGTIALDFTPPITPDNPLIEGQTILVALHGLTGGSHESYVRDVMKKVTSKKDEQGLGWRGVVVNFRGCAGSPVTGGNFQLYHGGYTDDLRCALAYLSHLTPQSPLHGIGFSLGANVLAKYLGEEGAGTPLKSGVILGCPFDFYEGHLFLSQGYLKSIYSKAMAKNLRTMLGRHAHIFDHDKRLDQRAIYQNPNQTLFVSSLSLPSLCSPQIF
jgi:predicted alpha/beta-fold hydrolase